MEVTARTSAARLASVPGCSIGAHCVHHLRLPQLDDFQRRSEVEGSKSTLERFLGHRVSSFADPYGEHDAATVQTVRDARFSVAVTVQAGPVAPTDELLQIPRVEVNAAWGDRFPSRLRRVLGEVPA